MKAGKVAVIFGIVLPIVLLLLLMVGSSFSDDNAAPSDSGASVSADTGGSAAPSISADTGGTSAVSTDSVSSPPADGTLAPQADTTTPDTVSASADASTSPDDSTVQADSTPAPSDDTSGTVAADTSTATADDSTVTSDTATADDSTVTSDTATATGTDTSGTVAADTSGTAVTTDSGTAPSDTSATVATPTDTPAVTDTPAATSADDTTTQTDGVLVGDSHTCDVGAVDTGAMNSGAHCTTILDSSTDTTPAADNATQTAQDATPPAENDTTAPVPPQPYSHSASVSPSKIGGDVATTLAFTITNNGPANMQSITLQRPSGVDPSYFIDSSSVQCPDGWNFDAAASGEEFAVCNAGAGSEIASGSSATITLDVYATGIPECATRDWNVQSTSDAGDSYSSSLPMELCDPATNIISVGVSPSSVSENTAPAFTFTVTNEGPNKVKKITIDSHPGDWGDAANVICPSGWTPSHPSGSAVCTANSGVTLNSGDSLPMTFTSQAPDIATCGDYGWDVTAQFDHSNNPTVPATVNVCAFMHVNLVSPADYSTLNSTAVNFNFKAYDEDPTSDHVHCSLIVDGVNVTTSATLFVNGASTGAGSIMTHIPDNSSADYRYTMAYGEHTWQIFCRNYVDAPIGDANVPKVGVYSDTWHLTVPSPVVNGTLTVIKNVAGGNAIPSNFTMHVYAGSALIASFPGSNTGTAISLSPGTYSVTESGASNYNETSAANCSGTISAGQARTCVITNTYEPPTCSDGTLYGQCSVAKPKMCVNGALVDNATSCGCPSGQVASGDSCIQNIATLTVIKHVINDNGGTLTAANFIMLVNGTNVSNSTFAGSEAGVSVTLVPGAYSVNELMPTSTYAKTIGEGCSGTISAGQAKTCTITNNDMAPIDTQPPVITRLSPLNGSILNSSTVILRANVTDDTSANIICNLSVDGTLKATISYGNGIPYSVTIMGNADGTHTWNMLCIDDAGNRAQTNDWQFTVNTTVSPTQNFTRPCGTGIDLCNWDVTLPLGSPDQSSCNLQYNTLWPVNTETMATCTFEGGLYANHTLHFSIDNDVVDCTLA